MTLQSSQANGFGVAKVSQLTFPYETWFDAKKKGRRTMIKAWHGKVRKIKTALDGIMIARDDRTEICLWERDTVSAQLRKVFTLFQRITNAREEKKDKTAAKSTNGKKPYEQTCINVVFSCATEVPELWDIVEKLNDGVETNDLKLDF